MRGGAGSGTPEPEGIHHAEGQHRHGHRPGHGPGTGSQLLRRQARPHAQPGVPGRALYTTGPGTSFLLYETQFPSGDHTVARWHVDDVASEVAELRSRGVAFEHYDEMPGVEWDGDVASIGGLGNGAWFRDSEGNVLGIDDIGL